MSTISPSRIAAPSSAGAWASRRAWRRRRCATSTGCCVGAALAITAIGLVMIYSTTHHRIPGDPYYFVKRQALFVAARVRGHGRRAARRLPAHARPLDGRSTAAPCAPAVAVLAPLGSNIKGHQAWFQLPGGFTLQPSELAKFGIIVALAGYCNQYRGELDALAPHHDHRAGERCRSGSCCSSPTSAPCWCSASSSWRSSPWPASPASSCSCSCCSRSPASTRWSASGS